MSKQRCLIWLGSLDPTVRVVRRKSNGGAIIEAPLARETFGIKSAHTAAGGNHTYDLTVAMLQQMVDNHGQLPGRVPIYFGHLSAAAKKTTPAAGYIDDLWLEGTTLMGRLDIGPETAAKVVDGEGFGGFSIEGIKDPPTTDRVLSGWAVDGGAITNGPATDIQWRIAASLESESTSEPQRETIVVGVALSVPRQSGHEGQTMSTIETITQERDAARTDLGKITQERDALKLEKERLVQEREALGKKATEAEADKAVLSKKVEEQGTRLAALETERVSDRVRATVKLALEGGKMVAAQVAGYDADPVKWLNESYFSGNVAAFERFVKDAPVAIKMGASGATTGTNSDGGDVEQVLFAAANKIAAEKSIPFVDALKLARASQPEASVKLARQYDAEPAD